MSADSERVRRVVDSMKASLNAAVKCVATVLHDRKAVRQDGELAVIAVESVVRLVEALEGVTGYSRQPWEGVECEGRYFAWSGPGLHTLEDRLPTSTPGLLLETLKSAAATPTY
jgi:hypothetical protein